MKPGAGADPIKTCKNVKSSTIVMQVSKNIILQLKSIDVRFLEILKTALKVLVQQVGEKFTRVNLLQVHKCFDELAPVVQRALVRHQT